MNNTLYEIIASLYSDQKVSIVYEEDIDKSWVLYEGDAAEIPMQVFVNCNCPCAELVRLECDNNLLKIVVSQ